MIIRASFECETCGHLHTVRIGMGQEEYQTHRFSCIGCSEDIVVGLRVNYQAVSAYAEAVENARLSDQQGGSIVNVHANFTIPNDQRHIDGAFPHLTQMHDIISHAEKQGRLVDPADFSADDLSSRPLRRPDYAEEWKLLKRAWSLHRNGRDDLSHRQIDAANERYYRNDPLHDIEDWVWRFVLFLGQAKGERLFSAAVEEVKKIARNPKFRTLMAFYESDMIAERSQRYFDIIGQFFEGYSEFSQVYLQVASGLPLPKDHVATSKDFKLVRMFYGNAFESLSSSVDLIAYFNNIISGRDYDVFATITKADYLKLDKASRFNAYALNPSFAALSEEADNQIRNASHHGSFRFDSHSQIIKYKSGKGGSGPQNEMSFVEYLVKSLHIFIQIISIFRLEILICKTKDIPRPI